MRKTIETKRLILRPFVMEDAMAMYENWASDEEVTKYLTWNKHSSVEVTKLILGKWIEEYEKPERINFGIVLKENNELIGGIDVVGYLSKIPVIGYVLSKKYWNNGYMTEACNAVLDFLFSLGHEEVIIDAARDNVGSNKVIQKCGGKYIKSYKDEFPQKNERYCINRYVVYKR